MPAIPWFSLIFFAFLLSGGENPWLICRKRVLPLRAPLLLFRLRRKAVTLGEHGRLIPISDNAVRFIYYKNWLAKSFSFSEQPQSSVRTSLLVPLSICLCEIHACGDAGLPGHRKHCGVNTAVSTLRCRADPYKVA